MAAADLVVLDDFAGKHPGGRVEAQALFQHLFGVGEVRDLLEGGGIIGQEALKFAEDLRLMLGVLGQQVGGPAKQGGGGLMPGEEDGHDLVVHLGGAHRLAGLLAARGHQHSGRVGAAAGGLAAVGGEFLGHTVD